jgi:hypothetical protein
MKVAMICAKNVSKIKSKVFRVVNPILWVTINGGIILHLSSHNLMLWIEKNSCYQSEKFDRPGKNEKLFPRVKGKEEGIRLFEQHCIEKTSSLLCLFIFVLFTGMPVIDVGCQTWRKF